MEIQEIPPFCTSPEPCANQCFLDAFFKWQSPFSSGRPILLKSAEFRDFSVSAPKKALWGPEWDFRGPCVKPFINTTFWEVFWRPRTGKVHFYQKKGNPARKPKIHRKGGVGAGKLIFAEMRENPRSVTFSALNHKLL